MFFKSLSPEIIQFIRFPQNIKYAVVFIRFFLQQQIGILEWFLKDHLTFDSSQIMRKNQIAYHYADDTQIYLALFSNDNSLIDSLCQCINEISSWMCQNFLQLNKEKTEVIAFGNKDEVLKVNAYLDSRGQTTKNQVRNLGVILETDLSFSSHVKAVTKSAYYHLINIARIRCFVSSQDLEKLVHAFITSRVDYCNVLLTGLPKKTIRQLQLIQNAAARILTRTRTSEHITPVLRSLHWLPVTFRIDFKVILLVYKSLNGLGPKYIADTLIEYKPNLNIFNVYFTSLTYHCVWNVLYK